MPVYASDGSINVTVVDGNSIVGLYAADGSLNVIESPGTSPVGAFHPSGALWVTESPGGIHSSRAPDGSLYVQESPYTNGGTRVTVVSGSLGGGGGTPVVGNPIGLLLSLTYAA